MRIREGPLAHRSSQAGAGWGAPITSPGTEDRNQSCSKPPAVFCSGGLKAKTEDAG